MPFIFSIGKPKVNKSTKTQMWEITPIGQQKVEGYTGAENPKFKVLASVASIGPANVEDISKDAGIGADTVAFQLRQLAAERCVRVMGAKSKE